MRRACSPESLEAFEQLLALPDPQDLPRRGRVVRWEGDPNRRTTRLLPLVMCWLQRRLLESDGEEPPASAVRTQTGRAPVAVPGFRLLPWTAVPVTRTQQPDLERLMGANG